MAPAQSVADTKHRLAASADTADIVMSFIAAKRCEVLASGRAEETAPLCFFAA
jgi:hypothetical protein